jgi:hypothetical protein
MREALHALGAEDLARVAICMSGERVDVMMTLACRTCGFALTKKGSWFKSASLYKCESCGVQGRVTYDDKVRLFARAAAEGQRIRKKG